MRLVTVAWRAGGGKLRVLAGLIALVALLSAVACRSSQEPDPAAQPTGAPAEAAMSPRPATPTPSPTPSPAEYGTPPPEPPTPHLKSIDLMIDLAPDIEAMCEIEAHVLRHDGKRVVYRIPAWLDRQDVPLSPGDQIELLVPPLVSKLRSVALLHGAKFEDPCPEPPPGYPRPRPATERRPNVPPPIPPPPPEPPQ